MAEEGAAAAHAPAPATDWKARAAACGAPGGLNATVCEEYCYFGENRGAPSFVLTKGSKWVLEEKATLRETYRTYCLPKMVSSRLKLVCTVYGCCSDVNYHNIKDERDDFSFSNFRLHLLSCKGCPGRADGALLPFAPGAAAGGGGAC